MLSRTALTARSLARTAAPSSSLRTISTTRSLQLRTDINVLDPELNGNYPNPPAIKRQFRDPQAKYWDQQERRNYGEPVHEDNDILGVFATEKYTWTTPGWGGVLFGTFVVSVLALCAVVNVTYPDKPAVAREFDLVSELGGKEALIAPKAAGTDESSADL